MFTVLPIVLTDANPCVYSARAQWGVNPISRFGLPKINRSAWNAGVKTLILALVSVLILAACADTKTSTLLNNIHMGMTREQVVSVMRLPPDRVSSISNIVYLHYQLENHDAWGRGDYFILLRDGAVASYGRNGDFDTTQLPKERVQIEYKNGNAK